VNRAANHTILSPFRVGLILGVTIIIGAALRLHQLSAKSFWIDERGQRQLRDDAMAPFPSHALEIPGQYDALLLSAPGVDPSWRQRIRSAKSLRALRRSHHPRDLFPERLFDGATGLTAAALLSVHSFHLCAGGVCAIHRVPQTVPRADANHRPRRDSVRTSDRSHGFVCAAAARGSQLAWLHRPSLSDISEFLLLLTSQGGLLLLLICLSLAGLAFVHLPGVSHSDKEKWALRLLFLWLTLPPVLTLAASAIKPLFYPRYMVLCVPALVLLAARGVAHLYNLPARR
jgi:hypothetical protein